MDWFKKIRDQPVEDRRHWIRTLKPLAITRQCALASVCRSTCHAPQLAAPDKRELVLLSEIDAEYTRRPFYGNRKIVVPLYGLGQMINRKHVQRLMRILGMALGPDPHPQHKIYPPAQRRGGDTAQPGGSRGINLHPPGARFFSKNAKV